MSAPVVAVVGPGGPDVAEHLLATAREVGAQLAAAGATVVCGGLDGVMSAVAAGAHSAGGTVIGLLPGHDAADGNEFLSVAIPTGLGEVRNALVVRAADAVIAVGGGYGTLSEIALALKAATPVIGIGTWQLVRDGRVDDGIVEAADAQTAVTLALRPA